MKKRIAILTLAVVSLPAIAMALPAPKVYVCKYINTPGVNEKLQTGQNPINVSSNATKDYKGVGSYFNDAQGRSYVLAEDNGQPEPSVSECPQPTTPTSNPVTPTPNTSTPQVQGAMTTQPTPTTPTGTVDYTNFVGK